MKRLKLLSGLILAGLAGVAQPAAAQSSLNATSTRTISVSDAPIAKDSAAAMCAGDSCPQRTPVWSLYADFLFWTARGDTVGYGQVRDGAIAVDANGVANAGTSVPAGPVGQVDSYYSPGFRVGGSAILTACVEADVNFTWWQNRSTDAIGIPANLAQPFILPLVAVPATLNAANIIPTAARAHQDIHLLMGDATLKYTMLGNGPDAVKLVVGGRWAHIDQNFQTYYFGQESFGVNSRINFDGFGPKIGLEGSYTIWGSVFVYGRTDLSLLYGHFGAEYDQISDIQGVQARTRFGDDRVVPILETEIGLGWRSCNRRVEAMVGYTASNWFNTMTTAGWIESVQQDAFAQNRHNLANTLSFDGLFARLAFRF